LMAAAAAAEIFLASLGLAALLWLAAWWAL